MFQRIIKSVRCEFSSLGISFYLLWWFFHPLSVVVVVGFFLIPFFIEYLKEVIAFGCLTVLLMGLYAFTPRAMKFLVYISSFLLLSSLSFVKLSFFHLYGVKISASALFVIFETNASETSEFLENYLNVPIIILFLLLFMPLIWLLVFKRKKAKQFKFENTRKKPPIKIVLLLALIIVSGFIIQWKFKNENILLNSFSSYQEYSKTKEILASQLAKTENNLVSDATNSDDEAAYVVIIGESTSSWHMQLYGYKRETNPKLVEIKNELVLFNNVITPNVHTILALEKILTFTNFENPKPNQNASVVQLANAAGFETYWISNQQPVGIHESISTIIGNAAKNKYFIATEGYKYTIHDGALLPIVEQVLQEKKKKKLIFLHLIGTHVAYYKRYPKEFEFFGTLSRPDLDKKANEYINTYDNATRYNDSIIRAVIDKVKLLDTNSYVAYFSDHGDDVYDEANIAGHNEYLGTKPMYEVPFMVWFSEKYYKNSESYSKKEALKQRAYNLEDFMYSFAEISRIKFAQMDSTRSVFSNQFIERPRLVKDGENYDKK
ncbi:MAG TPA: hypothetical protein DCS66_04665 [Flavobacteriaceae bacterium]|nr:hypothetical protein [Flavobacteriaceae bacterium]